MSIEASLTYQKKFFNDFTDAWHKKSRYRLYQGLDATAENLRLDIEETPGYILATNFSAKSRRAAAPRAFTSSRMGCTRSVASLVP